MTLEARGNGRYPARLDGRSGAGGGGDANGVHRTGGGLSPAPMPVVDLPLDAGAARSLTERIRAATREMCVLLREAHDGRAWVALGYVSWELYVRTEFGFSRSRSYELLDQATVMLTLQQAAGIDTLPDVSSYAAMQIKPEIDRVADEIRRRVQDAVPQEAKGVVLEVVKERRAALSERRQSAHGADGHSAPKVLEELLKAVETLAETAPSEVLNAGPVIGKTQLERLEAAVGWLSKLVEECRGREPVG